MDYKMNDTDADNLISEIRSLEEEKKRYELIASQQKQAITDKLEIKNKGIEGAIQFNKDQLRAFFLTVDKKSTKTQESYSLLSGKLVMKKPSLKLVHDDKKLLAYVSNYSQLAYIKNTPSLDWSALKNDLDIDNGLIVNKLTGEVLSNIEGLSLEEVGEVFNIK